MAREFDGSTDMRIVHTLSANAKANFTGGGTILMWIRPDTDGGGDNARYWDSASSSSFGNILNVAE